LEDCYSLLKQDNMPCYLAQSSPVLSQYHGKLEIFVSMVLWASTNVVWTAKIRV